jgi:ankyrin repeat protein
LFRPFCVGESLDQKDHKELDQENNENKLHKAWQGWWNEKKKNSILLLDASKLNQLEVCRQLLDKNKGDLKADVNYKGENGWTPLHFACLNGNIDLVNLFLYNGAQTDAETTLRYTVLHLAAQRGHADIFQLLVNSGANFNATDIFNNTPLHYAAQNGNF